VLFVSKPFYNQSALEEGPFVLDALTLSKLGQLQKVLEIPVSDPSNKQLMYDLDWLALLKSTNHFDSPNPSQIHFPVPNGPSRSDFEPTEEEKAVIKSLFKTFQVPEFQPDKLGAYIQHKEFCQTLGLTDYYSPSLTQPLSDVNQQELDLNPLFY